MRILVIDKSAKGVTSVPACAELFALFKSSTPAPGDTLAVLTTLPEALFVKAPPIVNCTLAPAGNDGITAVTSLPMIPTVLGHTPPPCGVLQVAVKPDTTAGTVSIIVLLSAVLGPRLVTLTV